MQVITLATGRQVTIGQYLTAIRTAKAHPNDTFAHGLTGWWPVKGWEVVSQFFGMVADHCNRGLTIMEDKKGQARRRLNWVRKNGRSCRWCGRVFHPSHLADTCCSPECLRDYRS